MLAAARNNQRPACPTVVVGFLATLSLVISLYLLTADRSLHSCARPPAATSCDEESDRPREAANISASKQKRQEIYMWATDTMAMAVQHWIHDLVRQEVPSMVSTIRRQLTVQLAVGSLLQGIDGDFVETGVAAGGTAILLGKVLEKYDALGTRILWAADSFDGLPDPSEEDSRGGMSVGGRGWFNHTQEAFHKNMDNHSIPRGRYRVLKGWFNETLPAAGIKRIAYLRLDGDMYVSTKDVLDALYDKVAEGGFIYVDDYGSYNGCKAAVDEFRSAWNITSPLHHQAVSDHLFSHPSPGGWEAVWWRK